jgi:hypothetical protein
VTTTTVQQGWPCLNNTMDFHTQNTPIDGSCRTGFCFYVSDKVSLNLRVRDSTLSAYLITVELKPGFNLLAWCKESILEQSDLETNHDEASTIPRFSLLFCCNGMSLTFRPVDYYDIYSPYTTDPTYQPLSYQLNNKPYPPSITVLSNLGSVPSLFLLAKIAGGGRGVLFEKLTDLAIDDRLSHVTLHSLANRIEN